MLFVMFLLFFGNYLFSQMWTVRQSEHWDLEWRIVTNEEWQRLRVQKEAQYKYAAFHFTDVLEIQRNLPVIKGTRPPLLGYFYLWGTYLPRTETARIAANQYGINTILSYGNDKTGDFDIIFLNRPLDDNDYYIGSTSYIQRYNQCIKWVNGNY
jgi:hypothetical protein